MGRGKRWPTGFLKNAPAVRLAQKFAQFMQSQETVNSAMKSFLPFVSIVEPAAGCAPPMQCWTLSK